MDQIDKDQTEGFIAPYSRDSLSERIAGIRWRGGPVKFRMESDEDGRYSAVVLMGVLGGREELIDVPAAANGFLMELFDMAIEIVEDEQGRPWRGPRTDTDAA